MPHVKCKLRHQHLRNEVISMNKNTTLQTLIESFLSKEALQAILNEL